MKEGILAFIYRWSAVVLIVGGVCLAASYLVHPDAAPPETVASGFWQVIHLGFLISLLGGIFGLGALLAHGLSRGAGKASVFGYVMGVVSLVLIAGLDYAEIFIFPTLAIEFPAVVEKYGAGESMPSVAFAFPFAGLLFFSGFLMFLSQLHATQSVSRSSSTISMVGVVVFTVGLSGFVPMIVVKAGASLFGLGLVLLGVSLWAVAQETS